MKRSRMERVLGGSAAMALVLGGCASGAKYVPPAAYAELDTGAQIRKARDLFRGAMAADNAGRRDEAIRLYAGAIEAYRDFPAAWLNLGVAHMEQGNYLEAASALNVAADQAPTDPRPLYNLGLMWERQGWAADAQKHYNDALTRDPGYRDALQRSVYLDMTTNTATHKTLERLKRAMLIENDPEWRGWYQRQKIQLEAILRDRGEDTST